MKAALLIAEKATLCVDKRQIQKLCSMLKVFGIDIVLRVSGCEDIQGIYKNLKKNMDEVFYVCMPEDEQVENCVQFSLSNLLKDAEEYALHLNSADRRIFLQKSFSMAGNADEDSLKKFLQQNESPSLSFYVQKRVGGFTVTMYAYIEEKDRENVLCSFEKDIRDVFSDTVYSASEEPLWETVGKMLLERGLTFSAAESCTGGLCTHLLTKVPGISEVLMGSVVSYSNRIKMQALGVREQTLDTVGAVSEETAREMAEGIRKNFKTDIGCGITGIAGPGGSTPGKPVGLVYIGVCVNGDTTVVKNIFTGNRAQVQMASALKVYEILQKKLLKS